MVKYVYFHILWQKKGLEKLHTHVMSNVHHRWQVAQYIAAEQSLDPLCTVSTGFADIWRRSDVHGWNVNGIEKWGKFDIMCCNA